MHEECQSALIDEIIWLLLKINNLSALVLHCSNGLNMKLWINYPSYSKNGHSLSFLGNIAKSVIAWLSGVWDILPCMHLTLAYIGSRPGSSSKSKDPFNDAVLMYLDRCSAFARCQTEGFLSEDAMLQWLSRQQGRTAVIPVLLDSRGRQMTSEVFAAWLGARRDEGAQHIVFAIGPADGWTEAAREKAKLELSLGPMTLAHALARLVMAEQLYRAFTILSGHPYHMGH